jgi:hypothetical protein
MAELVRKNRLLRPRGTKRVLGPELIPNPLSDGIAKTWPLLRTLNFSPLYLVPSLLTGTVLLLVLAILVILWPYGWIAVISRFLWGFVSIAVEQIRQAQTYAEKMPFTVALGIYFLIWLPFGTLCLPLLLVGLAGHFFARSSSSKSTESLALEDLFVTFRASDIYIEDQDFRIEFTSAEWFADCRVRIHLLKQNKTTLMLKVVAQVRGSFFVDDLGDQYDAIAIENLSGNGRDIPAGAEIRYALVFKAPNEPPKKISLVLLGNLGAQSFPTVECDWRGVV